MSQERYRQLPLDQLKQERLALFIGADLHLEVTGLPSRADLACILARRKGLDETLSLAEVAQRVSQAGSRWEFTAFIRDALDITGSRHSSSTGFRLRWSTRKDDDRETPVDTGDGRTG
jgi:hypothetical protein